MTAISIANHSVYPFTTLEVNLQMNGRFNTRLNATCYAGAYILSNGFHYEYTSTAGGSSVGTWLVSGTAAEVWSMWTRTGGTLSDWNSLGSGTNNVRQQQSTSRYWRLLRSSIGTNTIIGYWRAYDAASGGNLLDTSASGTYSATYEFEACPLCCFTPDTLITMADFKMIPIKNIREGDRILIGKGTDFSEEVVEEVIVRHNRPMYKIYFDNGTVLEASEDHPLHVKGKGPSSINPTIEYKDLGIPEELAINDLVSTGPHNQAGDGLYTRIVKIEPMDYRGVVMTLGNTHFFANGICVY